MNDDDDYDDDYDDDDDDDDATHLTYMSKVWTMQLMAFRTMSLHTQPISPVIISPELIIFFTAIGPGV